MKTIYSDQLPAGGGVGSHYDESLWLYNGMDNCVTFEVHEALEQFPYSFADDMSRQMQAPALVMMRRGLRVDLAARDEAVIALDALISKYYDFFHRLTLHGLSQAINHRSPQQLKHLFYEMLKLPVIHRYDKTKRERVATTNREALEKLSSNSRSRLFAILILALRDAEKQKNVFLSGIDADNRMRCSYNVVGTETGRWASSGNAFGGGTNFQNITDLLRRMFIPDPGMKLMQFDLKQAESVVVANLSNDANYKEVCASGDPHTGVAQLCWDELPWSSATTKAARREIAERKYYRHFSYRDLAKRGGHGSNYGGSPAVLSIHLKIARAVAEEFQTRYFKQFSGIRKWHQSVAVQLGSKKSITTAFGRRRLFAGRLNDSSTLKEAIAYEPQSIIGDYLNEGMYQVWYEMEHKAQKIQLLAQVHDSILIQFDPKKHNEAEIAAEVQRLMAIPVVINGNKVTIHSDAVSGWNWGKRLVTKDQKVVNHYGLTDFNGEDSRSAPEA